MYTWRKAADAASSHDACCCKHTPYGTAHILAGEVLIALLCNSVQECKHLQCQPVHRCLLGLQCLAAAEGVLVAQ